MEAPREAFPLTWPTGQPRTPPNHRSASRFKAQFGQARDELLAELQRLGARKVIISTDVPLRRDGLPYADGDPRDPGVAVYFERKGRPYVIACDTYDRLRFNTRAIGATVEALRTIERHGSSTMLEQAFTGFAALPPAREAEATWWETLGLRPEATAAAIEEAHQRLALKHHPDRGGDHETMARINRARDRALEDFR
jgi:hypothetical protein